MLDTVLAYEGRAFRVMAFWRVADTVVMFGYSTVPSRVAGVEDPSSRLMYLRSVDSRLVDSTIVIESPSASLYEPVRIPPQPSISSPLVVMSPAGAQAGREILIFQGGAARANTRSASDRSAEHRARVQPHEPYAVRVALALPDFNSTSAWLFASSESREIDVTLPFRTVSASATSIGPTGWLVAAAVVADRQSQSAGGIELVRVGRDSVSLRTIVHARVPLASAAQKRAMALVLRPRSDGTLVLACIEAFEGRSVVHAQILDAEGTASRPEATMSVDLSVDDIRLDVFPDGRVSIVPAAHVRRGHTWVAILDPATRMEHTESFEDEPIELVLSRNVHAGHEAGLEELTSVLRDGLEGVSTVLTRRLLTQRCTVGSPKP